ncbi:hypothetical protein HDU76_011588 [Blyttiomyces sp. JEL0837]|nr:hypothetical protein HDU76_011588 [Blyttiomyces sp. JEL0837]
MQPMQVSEPMGVGTVAPIVQQAASDLVFLISAPGNCLFQMTDTLDNPSKNLAALWLRGVFHDAGTFSQADGSGGADGSLVNEGNHTENMGLLQSIASRFVPHHNESFSLTISDADLIHLGGVVTVRHCGGPEIPFRAGRKDVPKGTQNNITRLPSDPGAPLSEVQAVFERMGLLPLDMLVLTTGSHTMGGAHSAITPKFATQDFVPFDTTPGVFDNDIFKQVLQGNCVLPIDCAFAKDANLLPYIQLYATNQTSFFVQYSQSLQKLMELTTSPLSANPIPLEIPVHANLLAEGTYTNSTSKTSSLSTTTVTASTNGNSSGKADSGAPEKMDTVRSYYFNFFTVLAVAFLFIVLQSAAMAVILSGRDSTNSTGFASQLNPNAEQWRTIYFLAGFAVAITILWHVPILKHILWPFKVFTVALHEFGHASVGLCTGARVQSITLDPDEGGLTKMLGGNMYLSLPAGYLSSSFWGALMIFCGFNVIASKVVIVVVGICMLITLFVAKNWLARVITIGFIVLMGVLWYVDDVYLKDSDTLLRYVVLFLGVMSSLYSVWDIIEDLVIRKVNESDASHFSRICCHGCLAPQAWGVIWFIISILFIAAGVIAALVVFKDDGAR